jgi:protein-S-isoprenylcysteine O-methyltransferase Ste14
MTFLKGIGLAIAMNGVFMVLVPYLLVAVVPEIATLPLGRLTTVGEAILIVGALFTLWCVFAFIFEGRGTPAPFDAPKKLVVKGLYRFVRNPMYVGNMLIVIGETIAFQSTNMLLYTIFVFVMMNVSIIGKEEPDLRKIFGDSYVRYCQEVPRWIPRLTPARLS